jgi:hypothetical protein
MIGITLDLNLYMNAVSGWFQPWLPTPEPSLGSTGEDRHACEGARI